MIKLVLVLFLLLIVISVVRVAIRALGSMGQAFQQAAAPPRTESEPGESGQLKRDPVCGTYVPVDTSLTKTVRGETVYFCSAACRDAYS